MADFVSKHTGAEIDAGIDKTKRIVDGQYDMDAAPVLNSWRLRQDGSKLIFERYTGSVWEEKGYFENSIHSDYGVFTNMVLPSGATPTQHAPTDSLMFHMHEEDQGDGTTVPRPYFMDDQGVAYRILASYPDGRIRTYNQTTHAYEWLATEPYVIQKIQELTGDENFQADWSVTDSTSPHYIKNKPSLTAKDIKSMAVTNPTTGFTAAITLQDGSTIPFDAEEWFRKSPTPAQYYDIWYGFDRNKPPTEAGVKGGTSERVRSISGHDITVTRATAVKDKYIYLWIPDVLGAVTHITVGGLKDNWKAYALDVDNVPGHVYVSDNRTFATTYRFVIGTDYVY